MKNAIPTKLSYLVNIPRIHDEGYLSFAQENDHIPFKTKRIYYVSKIEKGAIRGMHAHKKTQQLLFCIQGQVKIILDDGQERETIILDKSNQGIFLDAMMWHEMREFRKNTILLVLASDIYRESDYIRDYKTFIKLFKNL